MRNVFFSLAILVLLSKSVYGDDGESKEREIQSKPAYASECNCSQLYAQISELDKLVGLLQEENKTLKLKIKDLNKKKIINKKGIEAPTPPAPSP